MASVKQTRRTFLLNSGFEIPAIGLGTWQSEPNVVASAVEAALRAGYRHIDTAVGYGNEAEVGAGIKASGVPRHEIFLTTKLNNPQHKHTTESLDASLRKLGTDYVDLWLMHWPAPVDANDSSKVYPDWTFCDTWREMQKSQASGRAKSIGVSNFEISNIEKLLTHKDNKIVPAVNQVELHPGRPSPKLVAYCRSKNIHCTGYSCLGSTNSPLYTNQTLAEIAAAKGKTVQQVLLMWGLQKGWSVIPKSVTPKRIEANFNLDDWSLSAEDMVAIDSIQDRFKVCKDGFLPVTVFFGEDE